MRGLTAVIILAFLLAGGCTGFLFVLLYVFVSGVGKGIF